MNVTRRFYPEIRHLLWSSNDNLILDSQDSRDSQNSQISRRYVRRIPRLPALPRVPRVPRLPALPPLPRSRPNFTLGLPASRLVTLNDAAPRDTRIEDACEILAPVVKCSICLDEDPDTALVPCGHMLCCLCAAKLVALQSNCAECRSNISNTLKIYVPGVIRRV